MAGNGTRSPKSYTQVIYTQGRWRAHVSDRSKEGLAEAGRQQMRVPRELHQAGGRERLRWVQEQ